MKRETMEQIDALLDGSIRQEDFATLQQTLKSDPVALEHYCQQAELDGRLAWEFAEPDRQHSPVTTPQGIEHSFQDPQTTRRTLLLAVAAVLTAVLAIGWTIQTRIGLQNPTPVVVQENPPAIDDHPAIQTPRGPVARLTNARNARWQKGNRKRSGDWLFPGVVPLNAGQIEVTFDSGARVILQGKARLELIDSHTARLIQGMGTVHIPDQASGFRLNTPTTSFANQDSSFSLAVEEDGTTEVHVRHGLVETIPHANKELARILSDNQSARLTKSSTLDSKKIVHQASEFKPEIPAQRQAQKASYLHWSFDQLGDGVTPENGKHGWGEFPARVLAKPGASSLADVQLIPGKHRAAVHLNGRGGYLASDFPGIAGSDPRTVAFWVRIPPDMDLDHAYSMVAWGSPQQGAKWQISWNRDGSKGGAKGAIRTEFGGGYVIGSTDLRDGRWHHVAAVYLGGSSHTDVANRIRHYIDGRLEPTTAFKNYRINTKLTSNGARPTIIGRRLEDDALNQCFKGALDELYIFPAALTPDQIQRLHLRNSPPKSFVTRPR